MASKVDEMRRYEAFQKWEQSLIENSRKGQLTKHRTFDIAIRLANYADWAGRNPDELIVQAETEGSEKIKAQLMAYMRYLQAEKNNTFNSAKMLVHSTLRGFYTHNLGKQFFGVWRVPKGEASEVSKLESLPENRIFKYDEKSGDVYVDKSFLQKFFNQLSFRDKTAGLCLLSTSQDPEDLFSLTVGFVRKRSQASRIFWQGERAKTKEPFKTFFSKEATAHLKQYVETERKDAEDSEPLFIQDARSGKVGRSLTTGLLDLAFRRAAEDAGIVNGKHWHNVMRPKRLRHIFRTACAQAGIHDGFAYVFMGHSTTISQEYLEKDPALLEREYVKVEPYVTVYTATEDEVIQEAIKPLEKELKETSEIVRGLMLKNLTLENKLAEIAEDAKYLREQAKHYREGGVVVHYTDEISKAEMAELVAELKAKREKKSV